jgi:hypothetical protein
MRQSAVTRRRAARSCLLRLALAPDGSPFIDVAGRAPGRGVYVEAAELREALSPKGLAKVFRGRARAIAAGEVEGMVEEAVGRIEARIEHLVGLARRAGGLAVGSEATLASLGRGDAALVVIATDASARTSERIGRALGATPRVEVSTVLSLGRAIGREALAVAAIEHPRLAEAIQREAERRAGLTAGAAAGSAGSRGTRKND